MTKSRKRNRASTLFQSLNTRFKTMRYLILALVLSLSFYTSSAVTCSSGTYPTSTYCTPCQVNNQCNGSSSSACSSGSYSTTYQSSCSSMSTSYALAGKLFSCPTNKYISATNTCLSCPSANSCNGSAASSCGSTQVSSDGSCFNCPGDFTCSNTNLDSDSPCPAGSYINSNSVVSCPAGSSCINGYKTSCVSGTTWALASYTGCNYCPPNYVCNQTPTSCSNGQYLSSLTSQTCSACSAGFICIQDWAGQIAIYPGTYAASSSSSWTECPASYSCTSSAATTCSSYTYSGQGETSCDSTPTFLTVSSSTSRSPVSVSVIGRGSSANTDTASSSCGSSNYCPGLDGGSYSIPEGITISGASITSKAPGTSCTAGTSGTSGSYSNGGNDCGTCSPGASDRSQCINCNDNGITSQFAESYYNNKDEREGVTNKCLDSSNSVTGTIPGTQTSGTNGEICGIEGSLTSRFPTSSCDAIRQTSDSNTKIGGLKVKYSLSHYYECSWCTENLNCIYQNAFFPFFFGYLLDCPYGEYSANGDLDCHRKTADTFCKVGYYRTVHSSDKDDQWIHDQDKRYECIPYNKSPSTNYVALDTTKSPSCSFGDWVRYGVEGCVANSPGFYNDENIYTESVTKCTNGFICKPDMIKNTLKTSQEACPRGSVGMTDGARSEETQCDLCRAGNYCVEGSTVASQVTCPQGYFCPTGTYDKLQFTCGAGFYGAGTGGKSFSDTCTMCPAAQYCAQSSTAGTACPTGYYCFKYSDDANKYPAMPGTYIGTATGLLTGATTCPAGKYCPLASTAPVNCPTGTYTTTTGMGEILNCGACPAGSACPTAGSTSSPVACSVGHYCPQGTKNPYDYACPPGTYTDNTNNKAIVDCTDCPLGKACLQRSSTTATTITTTSGTITTNAVLACSAGYYCPLRTEYSTKYPCPAGTYTTATNLGAASACTQCTAGKYCAAGSASATVDCPKNFYCPAGATSPLPCDSGQYSAAGASACSACTTGHICPQYHADDNPIVCPAGYYKDTTGSAGPCDLVPEGYYSTGTGAKISCGDGKWTPPGGKDISVCTSCPVGYYCASGVKTACGAGKWCAAGSTAPADCTAGYYCPDAATTYLRFCPAGTYSAAGASVCTSAPGGYYTPQQTTDANKQATKCSQGYYCSGGSTGPTDKTCDTGKYTLAATVAISVSDCAACTNGNYCLRGVTNPIPCPVGYYCISTQPYPVPCEMGSFRATTGAAASTDCTSCTAGKVCTQTALNAPDKDCDAGFYCPAGCVFPRTTEPACSTAGCDLTSSKVLPTGKTRAIECPAGNYCPAGSATPTPCNAGTYNAVAGQRVSSACLSCPAGKYCAGTGNTAVTGTCQAGYFCAAGSSSATQTPAPAGSYSIAGAASSTLCSPGTYQDLTGQSSCKACTLGNYCPGFGSSAMTTCPAGSYCPANSNKPTPCPQGTFSASTGLQAVGDCTACTAGKYCSGTGLTAVTGDCLAGYYCKSYAFSKMPSTDSSTAVEADQRYGPCNSGSYCLVTTGTPTPCTAGTYNDAIMGAASTDCKACLPGKYCAGSGNKAPTGDCQAGYYCPGGDTTATPTTACAAGEYCPTGSSLNTKCPAGTYSSTAQASSCTACTAGKFCTIGTSTPTDCPAGYYCPLNTQYSTQYPCPAGTYNSLTGKTQLSDCLACPIGNVCEFPGTSNPATTVCAAGYYCLAGSTFTIPESSTYGGMCAPGQFCPAGSGAAQACTGGSYCEKYLLAAVSGACDAGYYCTAIGAKSKIIPADYASDRGAICPIGKFCVSGTTTPADCPIGTYSASTGLTASTDCYQCPAGYYCDTVALTDYSAKVCTAGYFCPHGTSSATANQCPIGYYCPTGTTNKIQCDGGTYQDTVGQSSCKTCTKGNYCPFTSGTPLTAQVTCPVGYKCSDDGMVGPTVCPKGWYQDQTGQQVCKACPAGSYCDRQGLTAVSGTCPAGFYCLANQVNFQANMCAIGYYCTAGSSSTTSCPQGKYCDRSMLGVAGTDCWAGYYCNQLQITSPNPSGSTCTRGYYCGVGTINPTACGIGKYNNKLGSAAITDCIACPLGKLCDESALVEPKSTCPATKYCSNGSTQTDCDKGYYCPAGYDYEIKCQPGTYQDQTAQSTCKDCPEGYYCDGDLSSNSYLPLKCPPGYYCPAKTGNYGQYPCTAGKLGLATATAYGLKAIGDCTSCTATKYCDRRGLSAVSGNCQNGYLCAAGSILPSGVNTSKCPQGSYCSAGVQTSCNAGTYNSEYAATSSADCLPCEHGYYCPNTISSKVSCPAGKTCGEGLSSVSGAVDCLAGLYCPTGSFQGLQCAHGTYQDLAGQTSCKSCTAGNICNGLALTSMTSCPAYRTCPASSIRGRRCNPGQYIATSSNTCVSCLVGKYCWPTPKTAPDNGEQGTCSSGYVCRGGSSYQMPLVSLSSIVAGSSDFNNYNGQSFPGYTSSNGQTLTACTAGNWQPSAFSTSCLTCREGYYCPSTGLSNLGSYPCTAGYTCTTGLTTGTPSGAQCPVNTYCEGGNVVSQRCADGYKNPSSTGQASCTECGAGKFCYQSGSVGSFTENVTPCSTSNTQCSAENLKRGLKCQDGYELNGSNTCILCTATKYCRGGIQAGNCVAGYICNQDASSPISTPNPINRQCPINYYCKEAVTVGTQCQAGTFNGNYGAISTQQCFPCEPGYTCKADATGAIQVTACPIGYYCPEYDQVTNTQSDPIKCPIYTSSSIQKLFLIEMCTYCPAGYDCNALGITEYQLYPCVIGYYCLPNALNDLTNTPANYVSKNKCPLGTYGAKTKLTDKTGCTTCPAGYYCDPSISSTTPTVCTGGNNCPEGSDIQITCIGGDYCNTGNNFQQTICPVNYYCYPGVENQVRCPAGVICPVGSLTGNKCGKGFEVQQVSGVDTCIACAKGYYNTDAATSCKLCPAGYLCYGESSSVVANSAGGTNTASPLIKDTDRGEICPAGYYCPEGSYAATACPAGTYNQFTGMKALSDCLTCAANTYNDLTAQTGCQPCGEFAYSLAGAQTCTCYGAYRSFGKSDSSCRCQPRYVYRKEDKTIERYNVSKYDCIPLTYDRCQDNSQGRSLDGTCVTRDSSYCSKQCSSGGTFDITSGVCKCTGTKTTADEICNSDCRSSSSSVTLTSSSSLAYTSSSGTKTTINLSGDSNAIGTLSCTNENGCQVTQTSNSNGVPQGSYGSTSYIKNKARRLLGKVDDIELNLPKSYWEFEKRPRALATVSADTATISNPVVCIENGDSIQFEITDYTHYPVYDENNILNSNTKFDYGPFTDLASQIQAKKLAGYSGSTNPVLFSYSFTDGGTYVFTDATTTTNTLVIVVANSGSTCPSTSANIQTATSQSVTSTGSSQSSDIVLQIDYSLLCTIIGLLIAILCLIGVSIAYCLHKAYDISAPKVEGYRKYQKEHDLDFELLGDEEAPEVVNQQLCHFYPVDDEHDVENVNFNIHAEIINHTQDFLSLYDSAMLVSEDRKKNERTVINEMISEIDAMIKIIGDSAISGKMYYGAAKDLEAVMQDYKNDEHDSDQDNQKDSYEQTEEDVFKSALNKEILEREEQLRALIIRDDAKTKDAKLKREIMQEMNLGGHQLDFGDDELGGGGASLQDKVKQRIEQDDNFERLDKDKMLFDHDKKLEGIENELEKERGRQEHSLGQLLKARTDARRKRIALKGGEEKKKEELDKIQKEFEDKLKDKSADIDQQISEAEYQLGKATSKDDKDGLKEELKNLRQRKKDAAEQLEKDRLNAAKMAMDRLEKEDEMADDEIKALIDKFIPREKLNEIDEDFKRQKEQINQQKQFELEDLKRRQEEDLEDELQRKGTADDSIDKIVDTLSQRVLDQLRDADEQDKAAHFDRMNNLKNLLKNIDIDLDKENLMNTWNNKSKDLESSLKKDKDLNDARLKKRLEERRKDKKQKILEALRIAHEEEEAKLVLDQLGREHERKGEINRDQIKKIVALLMNELDKARENGQEIPELTLNKIKQLFETMFSEVEMTDFTNQLVKHFAEKEIMLKRLLARYVDLKRMEKASIKKQYADKLKDLELKQAQLGDDEYDKQRKELLFNEENALRELDLNMDKLHKEEEAALMQTLEKRNAKEAIQLRNDLLEEKIKAYNELFRNQNRKAHDEEIKIYKKALFTFKAKKEKELERRLRAIEFAKQKVLSDIDREIQNKIKDYEELLRRRSEEEKWIADRKDQMKQALIRHKELIKQRLGSLGETDKDQIFATLDKEYRALSGSIEKERKRLFLMMQQRDEKRKETYKDKNLEDFYQNLAFDKYGDKVAFMSNHTYMNKMLNQWKVRNDDKIKSVTMMEETAKREYMYLKQPGALISELLKRVKHLEKLLRNFDVTRISRLMQAAGDRSLKARIKR